MLIFDEWEHSGEWLAEGWRERSPVRVRYVRYPVDDVPELGLRFDRAYWVADLRVRDRSAEDSHGEIDATTYARGGHLPVPEEEPLHLEPDGGEGPALVNGQRYADGPRIKRRNGFEATLSNLSAVRFLTRRMGLDPSRPVRAKLRGDGRTTLRFDGPWPSGAEATLDGRRISVRRERGGAIALTTKLAPGRAHRLTIEATR